MNLINHYQIIKRQRDLNNNEINELSLYLKKEQVAYLYKAAISLLLDDMTELTKWIKKCSKQELKKMKEYPIWIFKK